MFSSSSIQSANDNQQHQLEFGNRHGRPTTVADAQTLGTNDCSTKWHFPVPTWRQRRQLPPPLSLSVALPLPPPPSRAWSPLTSVISTIWPVAPRKNVALLNIWTRTHVEVIYVIINCIFCKLYTHALNSNCRLRLAPKVSNSGILKHFTTCTNKSDGDGNRCYCTTSKADRQTFERMEERTDNVVIESLIWYSFLPLPCIRLWMHRSLLLFKWILNSMHIH